MNAYIYPAVSVKDHKRELYVTSIGHQTCKAGARYPASGHPRDYSFTWNEGRTLGDFTLVFLERGEGEFQTQDRRSRRWRKGELLLLPPATWHRYRPNVRTGWREHWLCLNGEYLARLRTLGDFPSEPQLRKVHDIPALLAAWTRLWSIAPENCLKSAARALELLALALEESPAGGRPASQGLPVPGLRELALDFIHHHCHRPLSVSSLAEHLAVSRRRLERHFAARGCGSIAKEIEQVRLKRALSLLRETKLSVKEIGYMTGFGGPTRFIQAFRRHHTISPGRFRLRPHCP